MTGDGIRKIADIAAQAFPGFSFYDVAFLAEGFHSKAYLADGKYVLRVGQTPQAETGYRREAALMPHSARGVTVAVPVPHYASCSNVPLSLHEKVNGTDLHHFNDDRSYASDGLALAVEEKNEKRIKHNLKRLRVLSLLREFSDD